MVTGTDPILNLAHKCVPRVQFMMARQLNSRSFYWIITKHCINDNKIMKVNCRLNVYCISPNIIEFKELFSSLNTRKLVKLSSFVEIVMNTFSSAT